MFPTARLRIVTWNCRSGSVAERLSELAEYDPHIVFLQECGPVDDVGPPPLVCGRMIGARKGVVLLAPRASSRHVARPLLGGGRAAIAAQFLDPVPFTLIGIWAQGPRYVDDVVLTLKAHGDLMRAAPTVVIGDLNSGSRLDRRPSQTKHHQKVLDACCDLGLVSAYHAFHRVDPGQERDATYFHQFKRSSPWHIDYCFVPRSWAPHLVNVTVVNGRKWARRSDHRPLLVELETASLKEPRRDASSQVDGNRRSR